MEPGDYKEAAKDSTVQLIAEDGRTIVKTFVVSAKFDPTVYVDGEWKDTEVFVSDMNNAVIDSNDYTNGNDAKRGIVHAKASGNFKFETNGYYEKRATPPTSFELKPNSIRRFIEIKMNDAKEIVKNDGDDLGYTRDATYETYPNVYLGRIHQGTLISEIVAEFKNNEENIGVFDRDGLEITKDRWGERFGSGYEIRLFKTSDHSVAPEDRVTGIIFGDVDGNGLVDVDDIAALQLYILSASSYSDGVAQYISATIKETTGPTVDSLAYLQAFISETDDFNSDYLTVPELLKV